MPLGEMQGVLLPHPCGTVTGLHIAPVNKNIFFTAHERSLLSLYGDAPSVRPYIWPDDAQNYRLRGWWITQITVYGGGTGALLCALSGAFSVVGADLSGTWRGIRLRDGTSPEILLVADDGGRVTDRADGAIVVTCGMARRDSVSCCSLSDGRAVVSVMRELPILGGGTLEEQDVVLTGSGGLVAEELAMAVAAMLCVGIAPERVSALLVGTP